MTDTEPAFHPFSTALTPWKVDRSSGLRSKVEIIPYLRSQYSFHETPHNNKSKGGEGIY